jgi:hypothetical protein
MLSWTRDEIIASKFSSPNLTRQSNVTWDVTGSVTHRLSLLLTEVGCEVQVTYEPRIDQLAFPRDCMKSIVGRQPTISELVLEAKETLDGAFSRRKIDAADSFKGIVQDLMLILSCLKAEI